MVHKKYIKRGGRTFGPYLYENYRENGITKTRYLGKPGIKKTRKYNKLFLGFGLILLLIIILSFVALFVLEKDFFKAEKPEEGLLSYSPLNFLKSLFFASPLNVFITIKGNYLPEIFNLPLELEVCENTELEPYDFYIQDLDGWADIESIRLTPLQPFYIYAVNSPVNLAITNVTLWSENLVKKYVNSKRYLNNGWAVWNEKIIVADYEKNLVSQDFNIIIIEVNNPPKFSIPVETILPGDLLYTIGDDRVFYYDLGDYLRIQLEETQTQNLTFKLEFLEGTPFFNISNEGIINVTGNESFILPGNISTNYHLNLSVYDTGLSMRSSLHLNKSKCYGPEYNEDPRSWSYDFWLTVTKENRAPIITSHYPLRFNLSINGGDTLYFNLTARDPDYTPLDVNWYVDGIIKKTMNGLKEENVSEFEYLFNCDVFGEHKIKAIVTDGLANASIEFNLSIKAAGCPVPPSGGGGGGGGGGRVYCEEKWGCLEWMQCQNLVNLSESGWASKKTELLIKERCANFSWQEEFCGFQQRICQDFKHCNTEKTKPGVIRECYYTENPTCKDNIKNCHGGSCEVLVDCGGPCIACPTCDDKIKNQNEEGIDCGGVCKPCVENPLAPRLIRSVIIYSLFLLLLLILFLVARQTIKYFKGKKTFQTSNIKNKLIRKESEGFENRNVLKHQKSSDFCGLKVSAETFKSLFFIGFVIILLFLANLYIIRVAQTNIVISDMSDVFGGIIASYGLINSFFKNIGLFFISDVFIKSNSKLQLYDDTEIGGKVEHSGDLIKFYANYTTNTFPYTPIDNGMCPMSPYCCRIQFQDSNHNYNGDWKNMLYNPASTLWEYVQLIDYKGDYNFSVECNYEGVINDGEDDFMIINAIPEIMKERYRDWIDFDGIKDNHDVWPCIEDILCHYDFSKNVTDPDTNDIWVYSVETSNTTLTNYILNSATGVLEIGVTNRGGVGRKKIQLGVKDNESDALMHWALLDLNIQEVNDAPVFDNLKNKTLIINEPFTYNILINDEEWSAPFVFNLSFIKCNAPTRNNCTLLREGIEYNQDKDNGILNINFTPTINDIGIYEINFSVMDYNISLGNSTTSKTVNFSVSFPIWTEPLETNYLFNEGEFFSLNLSKNVTLDRGKVSFSKGVSFPSFNITSDGFISFVPDDKDVGFWQIEVIATNPELSSFKIFNFTIFNQNDSLSFPLHPIQADNAIVDINSNVEAFENADVKIFLFVEDNDLAINESQKAAFYDEKINLSLNISGPNPNLFNFVFNGVVQKNKSMHIANFIPITGTAGVYNIIINARDANKFSNASFNFTLKIIDRNYTIPNITYPDDFTEFNFTEGITTNLIFRANHSAQNENLIYSIYINGTLRDSFLGFGNDTNVTWGFTPNFTDETYGNKTNLTLRVKNQNPYYPDLWSSRTWNLTINHSNAPVEFIDEILNSTYPINFPVQMNLKYYFFDVDHEDDYYNQKVKFDVFSDSNNSDFFISDVSEDWKLIVFSPTERNVTLNITASDLNMSNKSIILTSVTSNNFQIQFLLDNPETVIVYVPTPGSSSGSSSTNIVSLKILTPGKISVYEGEKIEIPLQLINTGTVSFNDLFLNSSAFKQGKEISELETSLDKNSFKTLAPGKQENLSLSVFFNTNKTGEYEILVTVESKYPKYKDWGKIHVELRAINESQVRELLVFTEEFIVQNPQCIEITEVVKEAEQFLELRDYVNANLKTKEALESCKKAISQVSVPKTKIKYFNTSLYLVLTIFIAVFLGLIYYFIQRRRIQNAINATKIKEEAIKRF